MIRYITRCKENIALGAIMSKFEYLKLADTVAAEIANGALKPGDRLPPQRSFAYERKIAVSTASRVYTELLRRLSALPFINLEAEPAEILRQKQAHVGIVVRYQKPFTGVLAAHL